VAKYVSVLWIGFDVAICVRTSHMTSPFPHWEFWTWCIGGVLLGFFALIAGFVEEKANRKTARELTETLGAQGKRLDAQNKKLDAQSTEIAGQQREIGEQRLQLEKQEGILTGLGQVSRRSLELAEEQAEKTGAPEAPEFHQEVAKLKAELENVKVALGRSYWGGSVAGGPKASVQIKYGNQPSLLVTNEGPAADFYGVFEISGLVSTEHPSGLYCKWADSDSVKIKIAKEQTCRVILANLNWSGPPIYTARWEIFATTEKEGPRVIPAIYTSLADPVTPVPEIVLTGRIFAIPDLENGPQPFRIVLQAFGSANQSEGA